MAAVEQTNRPKVFYTSPFLIAFLICIEIQGQAGGLQPSALEESSGALNGALRALSQRLSALTSNASAIDPASISSTAEAMSKILEAISQAKALSDDSTA